MYLCIFLTIINDQTLIEVGCRGGLLAVQSALAGFGITGVIRPITEAAEKATLWINRASPSSPGLVTCV